jgi:AsmA protein
MDMTGDLNINIQTKGNYLPAKKIFPVTKADFSLNNGMIQTSYYPRPIENIQVKAIATDTKGTLKDLSFEVQPVSFTFEGQPFMVKADLRDFDNLRYDISSKGVIDLGKIYRVFSQKGMDVKGFIRTSLTMKGSQADAMAGRYERLFNAGELVLEDIAFNSDNFSKNFFY